MKPTYNPGQVGVDFGESSLVNDIGTVIDMEGFPDVGVEDVFQVLKNNRVEHVLKVYRLAMEIWEETLDEEIVEELRNSNDFTPASNRRIADALGTTVDSVETEVELALSALRDTMRELEQAA